MISNVFCDSRRRFTIAALVTMLALVAAGCGGGGSDDSSSTAADSGDVAPSSSDDTDSSDDGAASSVEDEETEEVPEAEAEPVADQDQPGGQRTVVTIGDEQFSSDESVVCISLGGAVAGIFVEESGAIEISIDIPPEDWESSSEDWQPPSVRVSDERDPQNERQWEANVSNLTDVGFVSEGTSQVDSFSVNGSSASGTATFIDLRAGLLAEVEGTDPPAAVTGTFEINCG